MMQAVLAYIVNAAWETPLATLGAGLLCRMAGFSPRARYVTWALCLGLVLALPAAPSMSGGAPARGEAVAVGGEGSARALASAQDRPPGLRSVRSSLPVDRRLAGLLVGAAGLAATLALVRLLLAVHAARSIVRRSRAFRLDPDVAGRLQAFMARSGRAVPPIRCSAAVSGPAVAGCRPAVILVPQGFERLSADHACAALLHECAHVVRGDYAANLALQVIAAPLVWHPAVHLVKRRLAAAREAVCDGLAAAEMGSAVAYAERLVELARSVQQASRRRTGAALALFGRGELEARVGELVRAGGGGRCSALRAGMAAGLSLLVLLPTTILHVDPALEQARTASAWPSAKIIATTLPEMQPRRAETNALRRPSVHPVARRAGRISVRFPLKAASRSQTPHAEEARLQAASGTAPQGAEATSAGLTVVRYGEGSAPSVSADLVLRGSVVERMLTIDGPPAPVACKRADPPARSGNDTASAPPSAPTLRPSVLEDAGVVQPGSALMAETTEPLAGPSTVAAVAKPAATCVKAPAPGAGDRTPGVA